MKRILGLDLGTNSIGWAVVKAEQNESDDLQLVGIEAAGSRIIPMDAATLSDFDRGNCCVENVCIGCLIFLVSCHCIILRL